MAVSLSSFLTTERSEVVPFFRAVWARKKRGRSPPTPGGAQPPSSRGREATPILQGARLRSLVFSQKVALNIARFERNFAGMIFEHGPTVPRCWFAIRHQGAKLLSAKGGKMGISAVFSGL